MKRVNIFAFVVVVAGTGVLLSTQAQSQLGVKNLVALQGSTPGTSQSGHANISGRLTAGGLHSTGFMTVGPSYNSGIGSGRLMVGDAANSGFDGIYTYTGAAGKPFYGYSTGTAQAWTYLDGGDGNKWKLNYLGTRLTVQSDGKVGIGTNSPLSLLNISQSSHSSTYGMFTSSVGPLPMFGASSTGVMGSSNDESGEFTAGGIFYGEANQDTYGIAAVADNSIFEAQAYGVFGSLDSSGPNQYAGYFNGFLFAIAATSGVKSFLIDHPLDPENKLLEHSSVESDQRMNIYRGSVITDATGRAWVSVPDWFSALNKNIQYQLTVVFENENDDFVQSAIAKELNEQGKFLIRTSQPHVKVNWLVSGERHDPTSEYMPLVVEREKTANMKGKYMVPEAYGLKRDRAMHPGPAQEQSTTSSGRAK